jgi:hypothetical protein
MLSSNQNACQFVRENVTVIDVVIAVILKEYKLYE